MFHYRACPRVVEKGLSLGMTANILIKLQWEADKLGI